MNCLGDREQRKERLIHCDSVFLSFPKSGRTWVRHYLASYFESLAGTPLAYQMSGTQAFNKNRRRIGLPALHFTHDFFDYFQDSRTEAPKILDEELYLERRLIVLVRDPRDVVVSYFHQKSARESRDVGKLEDFVYSRIYGIERQSQFVLREIDLAERHQNAILISYERLHNDRRVWLDILNFLGVPLDQEMKIRAEQQANFDSMRQAETRLGSSNPLTKRSWNGDENALKVRRGRPMIFVEEMSTQLIDALRELPETARLLHRINSSKALRSIY